MSSARLHDLVIDRPQDGLFSVSRRLFTDPELYEQELQNIFEGSWIYLAHESQLPNPGDFFAVHMGRQPVFLLRGKDGQIRGFLNACAHRGAALCRTEKGNKSYLTCPYHGWVYDLTGRNVEIKDHATGAYPEPFEQQSHDLTPIARVANYRGFIFGSLRAEVPPVEDYLGASRAFVDMLADQSPGGIEVLPGASTYTFEGNWKLQAENGIDGYHFSTIHSNYVGVLQRRAQLEQRGQGQDRVKASFDQTTIQQRSGWYDFGGGHAMLWITFALPHNRPMWSQREELEKRIGKARADWLLYRQRNLLLFPNVLLMDQASSQIRVFRPLSVNRTEVKIYCIAAKGEPAADRERRIRQYEDFFNATGMATPDDCSVFELCQAGYEVRKIEWQQGYERGMARIIQGPDALARELGSEPAWSGVDPQDETLMIGIYRQWLELMGAHAR